MKIFIYVFASLLFSLTANAADVPALNQLFQQQFISGYTEGKCGQNVEGFLKKAQALGIDIRGTMMLEIQQYGDLWVYYARSANKTPQKRNFFFHYAIVISQNNSVLDNDDIVIDFDFGNEPRPVPLKDYLETMLMPSKLRGQPDLVDKDFDMGLTKFTGVNAQVFINAKTPEQRKSALIFNELKMRDLYRSLN